MAKKELSINDLTTRKPREQVAAEHAADMQEFIETGQVMAISDHGGVMTALKALIFLMNRVANGLDTLNVKLNELDYTLSQHQ